MSKVCQITGARPSIGHKVSHSNRKTLRRYEPNLVSKRVWNAKKKKWERVRLTVRALRTIRKQVI